MTRATFQKGGKWQRMESALENPSAALKQIGALMLSESQRAFKLQQFGKTQWDARRVPNVFGIIADFALSGRTAPPKRRFDARPALIDKGSAGGILGTIDFHVVGKNTVEVGTRLPYAGVHQIGGPVESEKITETLQKKLWKWLKKQSKERKDQLGWLLNKKLRGQTRKMRVPARPFIGITDLTRENVREAIGVHIFEVK